MTRDCQLRAPTAESDPVTEDGVVNPGAAMPNATRKRPTVGPAY